MRQWTRLIALVAAPLAFAPLACSVEPPGETESFESETDELVHNPCKLATLGNGDYCSKSLNPNATGENLYTCVNKTTASMKSCSHGCQIMPDGTNDVCAGSSGSSNAVSRARAWVNAGMPYCGGVEGGTDWICGGTCWRPDSAVRDDWDDYRSDCSGLVSYSWHLSTADGGRRTWEFAPFDTSISHTISAHSLQPGDALNSLYPDYGDQHIMLFAGWVDESQGLADIIEEANCGLFAKEHTISLSFDGGSDVYIDYYGPYAAIRKD